MNRGPVLTLLVGVRERRRRALEDAVRSAVQKEEAARAQAQAAQQALAEAVEDETSERSKLRALTAPGATFAIELLMLREHALASRTERVARQRSELEEREATLGECRQHVLQRRGERARNARKIDSLNDDLRAWRQARQRDQDDAQDEDAEEAAVGRLLRERGAAR